ncbi:MAG: electron transfer flavoprotein subunit alpha/FixB family protein [Acidimicrobiia bacterium]
MIFVLITHDRGEIEESTLQGLTLARSLGDEIHAVSIGAEIEGLAEYGVAKHHVITYEGLDDYSPMAWGEALAQLTVLQMPEAVVTTGTERGNEVMAHLGAVTGFPMVANCTEIDASGELWQITRTRWGGSLLEAATLEAPIKLVTVTEHSVEATPAPATGAATVEHFTPELSVEHLVTKVVDREVTAEGVTLATAPVVVSGGRGVGSPEGFGPLEELAGLLGGVVGCSRVVTNNGWRPHSDQVGQTGTVVAPDLYIACGISGAIQHWVGMMASKTIIAINTDAEAPMVTKADYAVIGDLAQVVPAIVQEIKRRHA